MKSIQFFLCILCASFAVAQKVPNIAVSPFVGDKNVTDEQLAFISGKFAGELMKTNTFTVLDRGKMDYILKEQGFQQSGVCNTSECKVQMGQMLGVDLMVSGNLVRFGTTYALHIELIDVGTGKMEFSIDLDEKGDLEDVYKPLCTKGVQGLAHFQHNRNTAASQSEAETQASPIPLSIPPESIQDSPQVPVGAIPVAQSKPLSTKRKVALALWGTSVLGAGFGVYSNIQVSNDQKDFDDAIASANYAKASSANQDANSAETRRTIAYGVSLGSLLVAAVLWFLPEGK